MNTSGSGCQIDKTWAVVTQIVDGLQAQSEAEKMTTEKMVKHLAAVFPKDFPVAGGKLSVVYWVYTTASYKVLIECGESSDNVYLKDSLLLRGAEKTIKDVIHKRISDILVNTKSACQQYGFSGTGSLTIVPMRVDPSEKSRVIGAFVLQVEAENSLTENDKHILDTISDRLAAFIHNVDYRRRAEITQRFFASTFETDGVDNEETILKTAVNHLTEKEDWFSPEEFNILILHPFDKEQLYLACVDGKVENNFRVNGLKSLKNNDLDSLLGTVPHNLLANNEVVLCNIKAEIQERLQIDATEFRSYALIPMLARKNKLLGFFILRNQHQNFAYKYELNLLHFFANTTASRLRNYRRDLTSYVLQQFRIDYIRHDQKHTNKELYDGATKAIETIYGKVNLVVVSLKGMARQPMVKYRRLGGNTLSGFSEIIAEDDIAKHFQTEIDEKIRDNTPAPVLNNHGTLFTVRAESGRITKLVIIESNQSLPNNVHFVMRELLSLIGFKQSLVRKKARQEAFTEFGKAITQLKTLTAKRMYELIYEHTEKVMSASNMYIALLDEQTQEISFPCFYRKDFDKAEIKNIFVPPRLFKTEQQGRTEVILATGECILIETKEQSIEWYQKPNREEKIGDYLASWIGVPIWSQGNIIGVIALYHSTAEFLYSKADQMFLEDMATYVSDLLNRLNNTDLKEANKKLNSVSRLAEKQAAFVKKAVSTRINTTVNNALEEVGYIFDYLSEDIANARNERNFNWLDEAPKLKENGLEIMNKLRGDIEGIRKELANQRQRIDVKSSLKQAFSSYFGDITEANVQGDEEDYSVMVNETTLKVCFDTMMDALFQVHQSFASVPSFSLSKQGEELSIVVEVLSHTPENNFFAFCKEHLNDTLLFVDLQLAGEAAFKEGTEQKIVLEIILPTNQLEKKVFVGFKNDLPFRKWKTMFNELNKLTEQDNTAYIVSTDTKIVDRSIVDSADIIIVDEVTLKNSLEHLTSRMNKSTQIFVFSDMELKNQYQEQGFKVLELGSIKEAKDLMKLLG